GFKQRGADFVVARTLPELVAGMNKLTGEALIDLADLERQIVARDREIDNPFTKDLQVMAIRNARRFRGDRLARTPGPVPGLFAAGEVAGFGGGGMHGYRSLEGSFLGGCLFSGRQAGRAAASETASLALSAAAARSLALSAAAA